MVRAQLQITLSLKPWSYCGFLASPYLVISCSITYDVRTVWSCIPPLHFRREVNITFTTTYNIQYGWSEFYHMFLSHSCVTRFTIYFYPFKVTDFDRIVSYFSVEPMQIIYINPNEQEVRVNFYYLCQCLKIPKFFNLDVLAQPQHETSIRQIDKATTNNKVTWCWTEENFTSGSVSSTTLQLTIKDTM